MTQQLPLLPTGEPNFENLRLENAVYVDKTMYFPLLKKTSKFIFCARPRRFGKSLTVTALDAFYSGHSNLFHGLAAENQINSPEFVPRPVIRVDMSDVGGSRNIGILEQKLMGRLGVNAERHEVTLRGADSADAFLFLIEDIKKANGRNIVVLIDEYDSPIISILQSDKYPIQRNFLAESREIMRNFYSKIKSAAEHIDFAFITGVTKFSRMGVFSSLNNLIDISLEPNFNAFMGYTHKELEENFKPFITEASETLKINENDLLVKLRDYYDGFSFDGQTRLYNPFSVLSFFASARKRFLNYWMKSGSNTFIRKFLKDQTLTADQFQGLVVDANFVSDPGEIDSTRPEGFLYQSGYLTLREQTDTSFTLDYPNFEVRTAFSALFLQNLAHESTWSDIDVAANELKQCLDDINVPGIVEIFMRLFADISYEDHSKAYRKPNISVLANIIRKIGLFLPWGKERKLSESLADLFRRRMGEGFYRSVLHSALNMAGAKVTPERHVGLGRIDLLVDCGTVIYVIELKMSEGAQDGEITALTGMKQILEKRYGRAFKNPVLVSLAIGRDERNIVACRFDIDGVESTVEISDP
ncbi:MAG: ATP-binding protein [Deltaproteobacteria bacterium]|nr:ATP-binding protein [Deltaproteobacteria bacterium]